MIAIVLFTHAIPAERATYAHRCFNSLKHLYTSNGDDAFWLHIADDGSPQEFRDEMIDKARNAYGKNTSISNSEGKGYGASYNIASQLTHQIANIILPLEDDWEVVREFNLDPFVEVLRAGHFDCIRMGYIGYTDTLKGTFKYYENRHFLALDPDSPEKHVFAGGPRLETVRFQKSVGLWPEGLNAGQTELEVAGQLEARKKVAWPISDIKPAGDLFVHIGALKAETGDPGSEIKMQQVVSR